MGHFTAKKNNDDLRLLRGDKGLGSAEGSACGWAKTKINQIRLLQVVGNFLLSKKNGSLVRRSDGLLRKSLDYRGYVHAHSLNVLLLQKLKVQGA